VAYAQIYSNRGDPDADFDTKKGKSVSTLSPVLKHIAIVALIVLIACPWKDAFGLSDGPRLGVQAIYRAEQTEANNEPFADLLCDTIMILHHRLIMLINSGTIPLHIERIETTSVAITPDMLMSSPGPSLDNASTPHRWLPIAMQFPFRLLWP